MGFADAEKFHPQSLEEWRDWLAANYDRDQGVWLVSWRGTTDRPTLGYQDIICEALCYGWIDGQAKQLDDDRTILWFTKRRPGSAWAASNKRRVQQLISQGRMRPSGQAMIDRAKADGSWSVLDAAESLIEPTELSAALDASPEARRYWDGLAPSLRKMALGWVAMGKRPQTRAKRISLIVERVSRGERPY